LIFRRASNYTSPQTVAPLELYWCAVRLLPVSAIILNVITKEVE